MANKAIQENHIWYEFQNEVLNLSKSRGVNKLDVIDSLVASIKFTLNRQVLFDGEKIINSDGTKFVPSRIKKIERRFRYELEVRSVLKKYKEIKKYLAFNDYVIEATIISLTKDVCLVSWKEQILTLSGNNFYFFRKKPKMGDKVRLKVISTSLNLKRIDNPIKIEATTRHKGFLQSEISKLTKVRGVIVSLIDIKKVYISCAFALTQIDVQNLLLLSPYRIKINHSIGMVAV